MSDHRDDTIQLERLVEADRPHPPAADLDGLLAGGRRKLRRRRIATSAAALATVVAIGVPAYAAMGGLSDRAGDATNDAAAASGGPDSAGPTGPECGIMLCVDPDRNDRLELEEPISTPWVVGELPSGAEEVIYTVRTDGHDLATGEPAEVEVLMIGYRQDGNLYRVAWTLQPGHEGRGPSGETVRMWADRPLGERDHDSFFVVGYVEGTPDSITWSTPDGEHGPALGMDTGVLPGQTVFLVERPLPDDWQQPAYDVEGDQLHTTPGDDFIITPGDAFPPPLTIHTSDGWSCSLKDCGSIG